MLKLSIFLLIAVLVADAEATPPPDFTAELSRGVVLEVWLNEARTRGFLRVDGTTSPIYRMWKAAVADLDGDGANEIVLGIWSETPRHDEPQPHRAIWVVSWDPKRHRFVERWRGSALARPLRDFTIESERLVATEAVDGQCFHTTYSWTGFGFRGIQTSRTECTPSTD